jgi:hypothetical protein
MSLEPEPAFEPTVDGRRLHAATLGEIGERRADEDQEEWERRRDLGKVCVICRRPISNQSTGACRLHAREWERIKKSPRRLAEWIARVGTDPDFGWVVIWDHR